MMDAEELDYPSMEDYETVLFDNYAAQVENSMLRETFTIESDPGYVYFTMAIFQNTYGLTDIRKPEFKITVTVGEAPAANDH